MKEKCDICGKKKDYEDIASDGVGIMSCVGGCNIGDKAMINKKSECKVNMESSLLNAVYQMGLESLCPETSDKLDDVLNELSETRGINSPV